MASVLQTLLSSIQDGVVGLSREAALIYVNPAAQRMLGPRLELIPRHPLMLAAVRSVLAGETKLPSPLTLELGTRLNDKKSISGVLVPAPSADDVLFVIHSGVDEVRDQATRNVLDIVREHLREPLAEFGRKARELNRNAPIVAVAEDLTERFDRIATLAEVWGTAGMVENDRIDLRELLNDVLRDCARLAEKWRVQFGVANFPELPPIYGSRAWLHRAMTEAVDNAIRHARRDHGIHGTNAITLEIRATLAGHFVLLKLVNLGRMPAAGMRILRPFQRSSPGRDGAPAGMGIGLPLAQRILELHGGQIRFGNSATDDATETLIQLPTGQVKHDPDLEHLQAQKYAADFAKLLARRGRRQSAEPAGESA